MLRDVVKGESNGKISMMRVASISVVGSVMLIWIIHNVISMFTGDGFVSMGAEEAMLLAGVLGAKAAQSFGEKRSSPPLETHDNVIPMDKKE